MTEAAPRQPTNEERLLDVARTALEYAVHFGRPWRPELSAVPPAWREPEACFITLRRDGDLRGCVGTLEARRPLIVDVAENAFQAACGDPRFAPLREAELADIDLHISLLTPMESLDVASETELVGELQPGVHGLLLRHPGGLQATFLPEVWKSLPEPQRFVDALQRKAGAPLGCWTGSSEAFVYKTRSIS